MESHDRDSTDLAPLAAARSDHGCFGCGDANPSGLHLRFASDNDGVRAAFIPAAEHQGFLDLVHGGIISTVLDEAMAWATAAAGYWAVTAEMQTRFRRPLRVGEATFVHARVTGQRRRVVLTSAELTLDSDGSIVATATGTFIRVSDDIAAAWQERYLPALATDRARIDQ